MYPTHHGKLKWSELFAFFIPLGISATLVSFSHLIINSTLARSAHPEIMIAAYSVAMSMLVFTERPVGLMRQTCSALVRDRLSFKSMAQICAYLLIAILIFGIVMSFTPLGKLVFQYIFGVEADLLESTLNVYRVLVFVSLFSGIRCLYQGIIITNMKTKWLTIGMVIRLGGMYLLSLYYIHTNQVNSAQVGAIIFLTGMVIEACVSVWEGRSILNGLPVKKTGHSIEKKKQILLFFRPMLYSSFIGVMILPTINILLGKTQHIELAIASFAIGLNLTNLVISFYTYTHQIVLNFYNRDRQAVRRFTLLLCFIPCLLIGLLAYTPAGPWFLRHIMGVNQELLVATIQTMRIYMIMTLLFPWLDFCNGIVMLRDQTKLMMWSQSVNLAVTFGVLVLCIAVVPGWNGMIGALAQSMGVLGELCMILFGLKLTAKRNAIML